MDVDQKKTLRVHIRWMIRRDMPEVIEIEGLSFAFPWPEEDFIRCLRQRNCIGMVADHRDKVVGFMIYELHGTQGQVRRLPRRCLRDATLRREFILENQISRCTGQ